MPHYDLSLFFWVGEGDRIGKLGLDFRCDAEEANQVLNAFEQGHRFNHYRVWSEWRPGMPHTEFWEVAGMVYPT